MTANLLTLNSSKTEFLLIGLKQQLCKIQDCSLTALLATLVLFSTNTLPSRIKSLHFLNLPTPVVGWVPEYSLGYPWNIPLNTSGEEALTTASARMFQSRTVREKKNKGDNHMMTVECGKPESFLLAWVQDTTWYLRALEVQPSRSESCKT